MIKIHCTKKLFNDLTLSESGQLKPKNCYSTNEQTLNKNISPFNHWHGHYFPIQRSPCLFLLHDATRFPLFIPNIKKADLRDLDYYFNDALMNTLLIMGADDNLMNKAQSMINRLCFDSITNRSVQGTINQFSQELKFRLADVNVRDLLGYGINVYLSERICTIKGQKNMIVPQQAFMDLLKK